MSTLSSLNTLGWCQLYILGAMQVTLFDVQQRTAIADLTVPFIKYIVWSSDMNHVALLSKHAIIVANKRLGQAFTGALHCNSSCAGVYLRCDWGTDALHHAGCTASLAS